MLTSVLSCDQDGPQELFLRTVFVYGEIGGHPVPLLLTYRGRPVHKHRRHGENVLVVFVNPSPGVPCERQVVSQTDWEAHHREQFFRDRDAMPDKRELARGFADSNS